MIEGEEWNVEHGFIGPEQLGNDRAGNSGDNNIGKRAHLQVKEQHLNGKHGACHGRLEGGGNTGGRAAGHGQASVVRPQFEELDQGRADG